MKKIIGEDSRITWEKTEFYFLNDLRIIQHVARIKGFDITLAQASEVWEEYSDTVMASFIDVAGRYILGTDEDVDRIWNCISPYFPENNDETISYIKKYEDGADYQINFSLVRKHPYEK